MITRGRCSTKDRLTFEMVVGHAKNLLSFAKKSFSAAPCSFQRRKIDPKLFATHRATKYAHVEGEHYAH